ncbi:GGDEF domain-containing protein [Clostridium lundense]|uniref:GGDEF domain-containing protein n=1 Tax=Clostridium lundense TaxID=319475 RepID=UPI00048205E8|nr:GGDEF domain-containing protein [Clostridium lundense]
MLDVNRATTNNLEQFYLMLKVIFLMFIVIIERLLVMTSKETISINRYFIIFYLIYLVIQFIFFIKNNNIKANLFTTLLDMLFLLSYMYINSNYFYALLPLVYIYILFQNIRFNKINPLILPSIIVIGIIFIIKKSFTVIFTIENLVNISFIYVLALISHAIISFMYKLIRQVNLMIKELHKKNKELEKLASRDYLTNMYTHRSFYNNLSNIFKRIHKNSNLCLAMFDIDDFKKINDTYGHLTGDFILKEASKIILGNLRPKDMAARYGGEEFALLLPNTDLKNGVTICEKIRFNIEKHNFKMKDLNLKITISCGISNLELENMSDYDEHRFIESVDKLLYEAKTCGKNCIRWKVS